eukprot:5786183-Pleurochrysis_carterae.AAC.1
MPCSSFADCAGSAPHLLRAPLPSPIRDFTNSAHSRAAVRVCFGLGLCRRDQRSGAWWGREDDKDSVSRGAVSTVAPECGRLAPPRTQGL